MLPGQMSPWQLESVLDVHRNLPLKVHQNRVSHSWDIADIEFGGVGGVCKVIFMSNPTVVLCWGWGFDNKAFTENWHKWSAFGQSTDNGLCGFTFSHRRDCSDQKSSKSWEKCPKPKGEHLSRPESLAALKIGALLRYRGKWLMCSDNVANSRFRTKKIGAYG